MLENTISGKYELESIIDKAKAELVWLSEEEKKEKLKELKEEVRRLRKLKYKDFFEVNREEGQLAPSSIKYNDSYDDEIVGDLLGWDISQKYDADFRTIEDSFEELQRAKEVSEENLSVSKEFDKKNQERIRLQKLGIVRLSTVIVNALNYMDTVKSDVIIIPPQFIINLALIRSLCNEKPSSKVAYEDIEKLGAKIQLHFKYRKIKVQVFCLEFSQVVKDYNDYYKEIVLEDGRLGVQVQEFDEKERNYLWCLLRLERLHRLRFLKLVRDNPKVYLYFRIIAQIKKVTDINRCNLSYTDPQDYYKAFPLNVPRLPRPQRKKADRIIAEFEKYETRLKNTRVKMMIREEMRSEGLKYNMTKTNAKIARLEKVQQIQAYQNNGIYRRYEIVRAIKKQKYKEQFAKIYDALQRYENNEEKLQFWLKEEEKLLNKAIKDFPLGDTDTDVGIEEYDELYDEFNNDVSNNVNALFFGDSSGVPKVIDPISRTYRDETNLLNSYTCVEEQEYKEYKRQMEIKRLGEDFVLAKEERVRERKEEQERLKLEKEKKKEKSQGKKKKSQEKKSQKSQEKELQKKKKKRKKSPRYASGRKRSQKHKREAFLAAQVEDRKQALQKRREAALAEQQESDIS